MKGYIEISKASLRQGIQGRKISLKRIGRVPLSWIKEGRKVIVRFALYKVINEHFESNFALDYASSGNFSSF